jgi:DNA-binding response OmpR family regulator
MSDVRPIRTLVIEDNPDFARLVGLYLSRAEDAAFEVIWKDNGNAGIELALRDPSIDIILMDYFMPGLNGLEVTRTLKAKGVRAPVIFLTVNKDLALAVEVMKLGVEDYLVKEEITTPVFPKTLLSIVEKRKIADELEALEIRNKRLEAMQELVVGITNRVAGPLATMQQLVRELLERETDEKVLRYLNIMRENLERISSKMDRLKNLKEDKTVQYIKDIRMIDLS